MLYVIIFIYEIQRRIIERIQSNNCRALSKIKKCLKLMNFSFVLFCLHFYVVNENKCSVLVICGQSIKSNTTIIFPSRYLYEEFYFLSGHSALLSRAIQN